MTEIVTPLEKINIPYGKEIESFHVVYENGFSILRLRIREGKRFTTLDLDADSAIQWGRFMTVWGNTNKPR